MIEIDFNRTHGVFVCTNDQCHIFRQPQGNREKTLAEVMAGEEAAIKTKRVKIE